MAKLPFVSVVVISYCGEGTLGATLQSLISQTYSRNRYEIIVVNDGSTDGTLDVARSFEKNGVRVVDIAHKDIAGARNAGLTACKGTIYVAFDDDCVAEPDWLAQLISGYATGNPLGVGGRIAEPWPAKGIVSAYISAGDNNHGVQLETSAAPNRSPFRRFTNYIQSRLKTAMPLPERATVKELYGASSSFPVEMLKEAGGWREDMAKIEDRDLSIRLRAAYPDRSFYLMSKAVLHHERGQTLIQYLLRSYTRGPFNLKFHLSNHLAPPVFPFPILFTLIMMAAAVWNAYWVPLLAVVVPQLLYFWWGVYAIRRHRVTAVLFPYIQLAEEALVLAGLAHGYIQLLRDRRTMVAHILTSLAHLMLCWGLIVAWMIILLRSSSPVAHTVVSLPFLLFVPGFLAWRSIRPARQGSSGFRTLSYSVGLSLLILMVGGLVLNETYIVLGKPEPLSVQPLVYTFGLATVFLAAVAFLRTPRRFRFIHRPHKMAGGLQQAIAAIGIGLLLPMIAAAGATTLNNGGSAGLAGLALGAIGVLVLIIVIWGHTLIHYYGWLLYGICLTLLFGSSLRGWNITGHDVLQEFQVFQLTLQHAAWHMSYYQDAYTACLSITILPTIIQKLTGIADPYVFKVVFQLFFALAAPIMYQTLKSYVSSKRALLATIVFLFFPTFMTDIMMLNRQETALLFFVLSLYVGLDVTLGRRTRALLSFLFLLGMVLSHYSTSYVALATLVIALVMALSWKGIARLLRAKSIAAFDALTQLYRPTVIAAALVALVVWGSIITQTSSNVYQTLGLITATISQKINGSASATPPKSPSSVVHYAAVMEQTRVLPANQYYPTSVVSKYPLQAEYQRAAPLTGFASRLHVSPTFLAQVYDGVRSIYALTIEGLLVLGLALALFLRKRKFGLPSPYVLLGVASLVLIGAQAYLPAAINYGATRVVQQALLVLALPIVLAGLWLLKVARIPAYLREGIFAAGLVIFFVVLSGLAPALTGGYRPVLPLANDGLYYQAYYTHQEEIAAAHWLATSPPVGSRIYSDEFMRRKAITYGAIFGQPTLVPGAIPIDSYVVLDYGNTVFNQVPAYDGAAVIYYRPPVGFLTANKDVVYTSGNIRIYR